MDVLLLIWAVVKIILWILLAVVAVVLVLLSLLLLCNLRYEATGDFQQGSQKAKGFASWLFNLVRVEFSYGEAGFEYNLKIPFKSLIFRQKKPESTVKVDDDRVVTAMDKETSAQNSIKTEQVDNNKTDKTNISKPEEQKTRKEKNPRREKKTKKNQGSEKKPSLFIRLKNVYYKYEIGNLYTPVKRFLKRLLKAIGIKKARANLTFGFDDPSVTGVVLGGGCALAAFLPADLRLKGYFDGPCLDGSAIICGKTCVLAILVPLVKFIFEKPVWKLIKML